MNQEQNGEKRDRLLVRRMLVCLDDSPPSRTALEIAARLAVRFDAELVGLFVQDVNLLRLTELPFAYETDSFSAARRRISLSQMEQQFRVQARRLRHSFTLIVRRSKIQGCFRVARGAIVPTLIQVVRESNVDMIILGKTGRSLNRYRQLGSTTRSLLLLRGAALTLILQDGACLDTPIVVLYDGSSEAKRALAAAVDLIDDELTGPLTVLLLVEREQQVAELQQEVVDWLGGRHMPARFRVLAPGQARGLERVLPTEDCGTLVLPARASLLQERAVQLLLARLDVPVLLVR